MFGAPGQPGAPSVRGSTPHATEEGVAADEVVEQAAEVKEYLSDTEALADGV